MSSSIQMDECHKLLTNKVDIWGVTKSEESLIHIQAQRPLVYIDFGLEELVPSLWVESEREYDIMRIADAKSSVISVQGNSKKYEYNLPKRDNSYVVLITRVQMISGKGISKNLHPNDFEDLFLLNIQEKLNHLPKTDKTSLHTSGATADYYFKNIIDDWSLSTRPLSTETEMTKKVDED
ncbi:hypothetical protein Tco_0966938 [Tanacetum coccineum]